MKSGADSRSRWEQILNINNLDIRQTRKRCKETRRSNGPTGTSTGLSPKATTSPSEQHPVLYVAEPSFYPRNGCRKKRHRFSRRHRHDCARHHPAQVAVGGAAKVN